MIHNDFVTNLPACDVRKAILAAKAALMTKSAEIHQKIVVASGELSHEPTEDSYMGGSGYMYDADGPSEFEKFEHESRKELTPIRAAEQRMSQIAEMLEHRPDDARIILERSDYELIHGKGKS